MAVQMMLYLYLFILPLTQSFMIIGRPKMRRVSFYALAERRSVAGDRREREAPASDLTLPLKTQSIVWRFFNIEASYISTSSLHRILFGFNYNQSFIHDDLTICTVLQVSLSSDAGKDDVSCTSAVAAALAVAIDKRSVGKSPRPLSIEVKFCQ